MKNILVFGTGQGYKNIKQDLSKYKIIAFIDNDKDKQGKLFESVYIDKPENINNYDYDYIILATVFYSDVLKQLKQLNIPMRKIKIFYMINKLKSPLLYNDLREMFFIKEEIEWYKNINRLEDSVKYIISFLQQLNKKSYIIEDLNNNDNLLRQYIYLLNSSIFEDNIHLYINNTQDLKKIKSDVSIFFASNSEKQVSLKEIQNLIDKNKNEHIIISLDKGKEVLKSLKHNKIRLLTNDLKSNRQITFTVNSSMNS